MNLEKLVSKYMASVERALSELRILNDLTEVKRDDVKGVIELAEAYLRDAKYYREKGKLKVSLASIAYCEGLLDALKMLGTVEFKWSAGKGEESEE